MSVSPIATRPLSDLIMGCMFAANPLKLAWMLYCTERFEAFHDMRHGKADRIAVTERCRSKADELRSAFGVYIGAITPIIETMRGSPLAEKIADLKADLRNILKRVEREDREPSDNPLTDADPATDIIDKIEGLLHDLAHDPYDDLKAQLAAEPPSPARDVAVNALRESGIKLPAALLDSSESPAAGADTSEPEASNAKSSGRPRQPPSDDAFKAYLAQKLGRSTQQEIAYGLKTNQGQVSRWVTQVETWLGMGNELSEEYRRILSGGQVLSMDPALLDAGPRQESGVKARLQGRKQRYGEGDDE